jgi:hypothetical protein
MEGAVVQNGNGGEFSLGVAGGVCADFQQSRGAQLVRLAALRHEGRPGGKNACQRKKQAGLKTSSAI